MASTTIGIRDNSHLAIINEWLKLVGGDCRTMRLRFAPRIQGGVARHGLSGFQ